MPKKIDDAIEEAIRINLHITKSDLIRDAVRRYLEENFPEVAKKVK